MNEQRSTPSAERTRVDGRRRGSAGRSERGSADRHRWSRRSLADLGTPSLLDRGPRRDSRPGERVGLWFAGIFRPLLTARYRAVGTDAVARTLLAATLAQAPGVHIIESERIA